MRAATGLSSVCAIIGLVFGRMSSGSPHAKSSAQCVRQDRSGRLRARPRRPRFRTRLDRRHRQRAGARPGCRWSPVSDVTGFPEMMDGRVKTLHPLRPRRHPGAAIAARRSGGRRRARHHPDRSGGGQPLSVRQGRRQPGDAVRRADRGDRHRRTEPGARRGEELPGRAGRRLAGGLRARSWTQLDRAGGPSLAFRFDLARKAFAHTGGYDTPIAGDAGDGRRRRRRASRRGDGSGAPAHR